jgi:penicillin V acylase-like amidase (Ntn superfamily)
MAETNLYMTSVKNHKRWRLEGKGWWSSASARRKPVFPSTSEQPEREVRTAYCGHEHC